MPPLPSLPPASYASAYIHIHAHIHTCTHTYKHTQTYTHKQTYTHIHAHTSTYIHIHTEWHTIYGTRVSVLQDIALPAVDRFPVEQQCAPAETANERARHCGYFKIVHVDLLNHGNGSRGRVLLDSRQKRLQPT